MFETLLQDIRYGARVLAKHRGYTAVAVLTLALGIGANTAIFSVVNAVLLRPLPFAEPEQLVRVFGTSARRSNFSRPHSYLNFSDLRAQNQTFEAMAAYTGTGAALSGVDAPEQIEGFIASGNIFLVLKTKPFMGRLLTPEDEKPGGSLPSNGSGRPKSSSVLTRAALPSATESRHSTRPRRRCREN